MNIQRRLLTPNLRLKYNAIKTAVSYSTNPQPKEDAITAKTAAIKQQKPNKNAVGETGGRKTFIPSNYRFVFPEFLPDPNPEFRSPVREKLERLDMLDRRHQLDIPEFYVGSILSVTSSDPHAVGKVSRFVGICIDREGCGMCARFILRNVVDNQGVEVLYEMYDPTIQKIEVLRLEKRLDDKLLYLRDALPEYSTFSFDMPPEPLPEPGAEVPVNDLQVVLRPRPWLERWERQNLKGVVRSSIEKYITDKMRGQAKRHEKPWEKYDMMKDYRSTIPEEEQKEIYAEVHAKLQQLELTREKNKRKPSFVKPKQLA